MTLGLLEENKYQLPFKDENIVTIDLSNPAVGVLNWWCFETQEQQTGTDQRKQHLDEITCPYCQGKGTGGRRKIDTPSGLMGVLKNKILYGQTSLYNKNTAMKSKSLMDELPSSLKMRNSYCCCCTILHITPVRVVAAVGACCFSSDASHHAGVKWRLPRCAPAVFIQKPYHRFQCLLWPCLL